MIIGLIDVDGHHFPNLALMKLSSFYKSNGDYVEWYDRNRELYDIVFISKVFSNTYTKDVPTPQNAKTVIRGGSGYAIKTIDGKEVYDKSSDKDLPEEIEHSYPDYSLYPEYTGYGKKLKSQTAYGFLTRGCPRGCSFCHVAAKEGQCSRKVANLNEFWHGQGNICLSDPNILACKDSRDLLQQLVESKANVDFNQGIDARLITDETASLLASMNLKTPHFAMDTMESVESVSKGIKRYIDAYKEQHGKWNYRYAKVFVLTNYNTTHEEDMERIRILQALECWPYVMIYDKSNCDAFYRRLQRWTNNAICYGVTKDFMEYQKKTYKSIVPI